jgi:hypothetical protein
MTLQPLQYVIGVVPRNAYGVSPEEITASAIALAILAAPVFVLLKLLFQIQMKGYAAIICMQHIGTVFIK